VTNISQSHPDVLAFIACLEDLIATLTEYDEGFWVNKLSRVVNLAQRKDGRCLATFEAYFGGMGSLNDLILRGHPANTERFHRELSHAYKLATELKKA
jgi:hypothetical protein